MSSQLKLMANSLSSSFILLFVSLSTVCAIVSANTKDTSTVAKDLVPCTMCTECENPCPPLPPPPPPVIECPPPPPPPSPPPPSPPLPPKVYECPPPPKAPCTYDCEIPQAPPYALGSYYPPGTPYPYDYVRNNGVKMKPLEAMLSWNPSSYSVFFIMRSLISVAFLCLPYYLFI